MTLHSVHERNTEINTEDFDPVAEQAALERICKDETIQVAHVFGPVTAVASTKGIVNMIPTHQLLGDSEPVSDAHIIYFWHGKLYNDAFKRQGNPFSYGPYQNKFYHRDRVAEILSRQKEALR